MVIIMEKCAFILPYFGKFPNYFSLFLRSCAANKTYNWLIFTDDHTDYSYPENVVVHYMTFQDMQQYVQSKFDFPIALSAPYKLCDFRPAYGYIFEEYLSEFAFWGHCDCDLIWGNLDHFLSDPLQQNYDKLFYLGHCTIYRNNKENNCRFMSSLHGTKRYQEVFSHTHGYTFDESYLPGNINDIFEELGVTIFGADYSGNIERKNSDFRLTRYDSDLKSFISEKRQDGLYVWENGTIYRYTMRFHELIKGEVMYLHFQNRPMKMMSEVLESRSFKITPNRFEELDVESITFENYTSIKAKHINAQRLRILKTDMLFWRNKIIKKLKRGKRSV